jgi:DNA-binding response OmpR family regulator
VYSYKIRNFVKKKRMPKILIIEDDPVFQQTLGEFLRSEGLETAGAVDGEEGIKKAREESPDLILLDIILPKKNGYEVIAELKKEETTKAVPIVLLTNLGGMRDVEKALEMGATTYLVKSDYKLEDVVKKIKEILKTPKDK